MKAIITYNPASQKSGKNYFDQLLTNEILADICYKVTGQFEFVVERKLSSGYNKGRLLTVDYNGHRFFVTFSEIDNKGRNSNVQSVPTAINIFFADKEVNKSLSYYFLPHKGNLLSDYYMLCYRLMVTIGISFLNAPVDIKPYTEINELIHDKQRNSRGNKSNNSSYITLSGDKTVVYGKVYGANKYESTLLGLAAAVVSDGSVDFYNICEKDLKSLPKASLSTFEHFKNIQVYNTSLYFDKRQYVENTDDTRLRSAAYIYNLYQRIGDKRCTFCNCNVPEIIQGAHIWNVADISENERLTREQKFNKVNSGHNGFWLCQNHHKLFDCHILMLREDGRVMVKNSIDEGRLAYIKNITTMDIIDRKLLSPEMLENLHQRNMKIDLNSGIMLAEL